MPYLSFDLDALSAVPDVARSAGIPEGDVAHGLLRMWAHCFKKKVDRVQEAHIQGFFGGDHLRVSTVLAAFGFIEEDSSEFRVKGAQRYLRVSRARSAGAQKTNETRWKTGLSDPGATPERQLSDTRATLDVALTPNTEHHLEEEASSDSVRSMGALVVSAIEKGATPDRREPESPGAALRPRTEPLPSGATVTAPETDPDVWVGFDFWCWVQSVRQVNRLIPEKPPNPRGLSAWWSACLQTEGIGARAMKEAYYEFGQAKHWENARPPWPFGAFMSEWLKYATPEASHGHRAEG